MDAPDPLAVAVRAYTVREEEERFSDSARRGQWQLPDHLLVFDTETTVDYSQRLNFGSWRYYRTEWGDTPAPALVCVEEGLIYADDLPDRYPDGSETLLRYADATPPAVDRKVPDAAWRMRVLSAGEFAEHVIVQFGYRARAWIVGFNLPFDLSRLAYNASESRDYLQGGFSLTLAEYLNEAGTRSEHRWRNRVAIKTLDSKRHQHGFKNRLEVDAADEVPEGDTERKTGYRFRGHFLDLRTLAFALTNESYSLERATQTFVDPDYEEPKVEHGLITPEYIDYNRQDVRATGELFVELLAEHRRHPIALSPTKAYSPASIGKAYLRAMGVRPRLQTQPDFPSEVLGQAMVAYYGGRAECRIRRTPVPVVYVDFLSMYPTVNSLMGLWQLVAAETVSVERGDDIAHEVQTMLDQLTVEDCFNPNTWGGFVGLAEVEPDGDVLPVRARYGDTDSWGIGLNPLHSSTPLWYSIPDLVAAKVLTGRAPRVRQALRLTPAGTTNALKPTDLRGAVGVNPRGDDFFTKVIEQRKLLATRDDLTEVERKRLDPFLKVLANSSSYGIYAEMIRHDIGRNKTEPVDVYGLEHFTDPSVRSPESPGEFSFPPMAACITGAARLMLALLERRVTDAGGSYAFCDTDSMAIVASEHRGTAPCPGGPIRTPTGQDAIRVLSWAQVDALCDEFAKLNPYDRAAVPGSVLEVEDENYEDKAHTKRRQLYCYSISAKRYALYTLDSDRNPVLRGGTDVRVGEKWSEHGLGHLLNPFDPEDDDRDWIRALWEHELRRALGRREPDPPWLSRPAVGQVTIGKPQTLDPFTTFNRDTPYRDRIKPFNFLLTAHQPQLTAPPPTADPLRFQLIAPFERDPREWLHITWRDKYGSGDQVYRVTTSDTHRPAGAVRIQSYRDVLDEYRVHAEPKSRAPDGSHSGWHSNGLLRRRPAKAIRIVHIGKEANELDDIQSHTIHDTNEVLNEHITSDDWTTYVLPVLGHMSRTQLRDLQLNGSNVSATKRGVYNPTPRTKARLTHAAGAFARQQLRDAGVQPPATAVDCCGALLLELAGA
jgi:hypothetical protein